MPYSRLNSLAGPTFSFFEAGFVKGIQVLCRPKRVMRVPSRTIAIEMKRRTRAVQAASSITRINAMEDEVHAASIRRVS